MNDSRNLPTQIRLHHQFIAALVLAFAIAGAGAITGTSFEGTDGDLVSQAGSDWDVLVGTPALYVAHDLPSGQTDDSFSDKEDEPAPEVVFGSIPGNKSDLLRFYVAHDAREEAGLRRDFLYLGWVRANSLGSANMDFEFNQSRVLSANGVTPVRTPGDMLITFAFSGSGATLGMSRWTATGPCEAASITPCWGPEMPLGGNAEGSVNLSTVADPIEGVTLPALTFGEAVIDLTSAGVFDRDVCQTFGEAYVKSRSSVSFTSSLKDYIDPQEIHVSNCSTLTIRKNAIPDDAQDFTFLATGGPSPQSFDLDDDGSNANALPSSRTWETPTTGAVSVTEVPAAGWDLTDITCSGDADVTRDGDGNPTGEVSLDLSIGAGVDCTFTNTKRGRILVDEVTIPAGDPQIFPFTLQGGPDAVDQSFGLAHASPVQDFGGLRPGTYNVLQGTAGSEWDLTSAVCSDGSSPAAVSLQPGETVTCTFTNTKRGRIAVDVVVTPSGDTQAFNATLTGGPSSVNDAFSLLDTDPARVSGYLRPGNGYAAAVGTPAGYFAVSSSCDDGSAVGAIALSPAETVTCTFAFAKGSRIVVDKVTDPAGDPALFGFTLSGSAMPAPETFQLAHATSRSSGWLSPGSQYRVEETAVTGWDLTGLSCASASGASTSSRTGNAALITPGPGDTVTCTFTNTKRGRIAVDVVVNPSGDTQAFSLTLTGGPSAVNDAFSLRDPDPARMSGWLLPGSGYAAAAAAPPAGYFAVSSSCDDGSPVGSVSLSPGETVTCTFAFVKGSRIVVDKVTDPAGDPTLFGFTLSGSSIPAPETFQLAHATAPRTSGWLLPGVSYQVEETVAAAWDLTGISCVSSAGHSTSSAAGRSVSIALGPADQVTCTFTNTKRGGILVDEVTIPSGDPYSFSFNLQGGPDAVAQSFSLADASPVRDSGALKPGTYAVSQAAAAGWDLTSAVCSDGSAPAAVSLQAGEIVTCTFTNTKRGHIAVDVVVTPSGDPQQFSLTLTGGPSAVNDAFTLRDADPAHLSGWLLPGGGYAAAAVTPTGYFAVSSSCDDGSAVGAIALSPGETVTCSFVFIKGSRIVVDKVTNPAGDPTLFSFTLSGTAIPTPETFQLAHATAPRTSAWLPPGGQYRVEESAPPVGWDLTGLSCVSATGASTSSRTDNAASIALGTADTVTCTFTNTKRGAIVIVKNAIPDDPQDFSFTLTGPGTSTPFLLDDDADPGLASSRTFTLMVPGAYVATQDDPGPSWDAQSITCTDASGHSVGSTNLASRTASFALPAGATITCVFTDIKRGFVIVEKLVLNAPPPGTTYDTWRIPFNYNSSFGGFALKHGEQKASPSLRGGSSVSVSESVPEGWSASSVCIYPDGSTTNGGSSINVTVPPGLTVHCTFINELKLHSGSSGFWRNWDNHYTDAELRMILAESAFADSPIYAALFNDGVLIPNATSVFNGIFNTGDSSSDKKILVELTAVMSNIAISESDDPNVQALQENTNALLGCILDLSGIPGAEELIDEWNPGIAFDYYTVDDVIAVAEAVWQGNIAQGTWSFAPLTEAEKGLMSRMFEAINQATILTADVTTYPDDIGCLQLPGYPPATEGVYYSATVEVNTTSAFHVELTGDLPPGLTLDPWTGEISGVPDFVGPEVVTFTFSLTFTIPDEGKSETREFSITVTPWPRIISLTVDDAVIGVPYSDTLQATGGAMPRNWSIVGGGLPAGLTLDPATGIISGTPVNTNSLLAPSMVLFTVELTDANDATTTAVVQMALIPSGMAICTPAPPIPTQSSSITVMQYNAQSYIYWSAVANATSYDVVYGSLNSLRTSGGNFGVATSGCLAGGATSMPVMHGVTPPVGGGVWFLIRPRNCGGNGSFDETGLLASRDGEIAASGKSCP